MEWVIHSLAGCHIHNTKEYIFPLISGWVGRDLATELVAHIKENDLPDPRGVVEGIEEYVHDVGRPDRFQSLCDGIVAQVRSDKDFVFVRKACRAFCQWFEEENLPLDILIARGTDLIRAFPEDYRLGIRLETENKEGPTYDQKLGQYIVAAQAAAK